MRDQARKGEGTLARRPKPPNILLVCTDDHGAWALGCSGNAELRTPSIDHLARTGTRLVNAFTPCPVCSPARASLLTGLLPSQHGIHDWLAWREADAWHPGLRARTTLPVLLRQAGYRTGLVGKWHCGHDPEPQLGFDRWCTYWNRQVPHFGQHEFSDQGRRVTWHGHQAPFFTEQAIAWLRERAYEHPFFLMVGYVCPHTPLADQPARLVTSYQHATFGDIPEESLPACHGRPRTERHHRFGVRTGQRGEAAQYYAAVSFVDEQVGRLLDELDALGLTEDTLCVYTADHGCMVGHHGVLGKGNATHPQNFLEEAIRVPCLFSWPAGLPAGTSHTALVDHLDLFATLAEVAGVPVPVLALLDPERPGRSYLPVLQGHAVPWRQVQFCEYGNARMVRDSRYKLIRRYPGPNGRFADELYDLAADGRECVNRLGDPALAPVVGRLSAALDAQFLRYEDPRLSGKEVGALPRCNGAEPWWFAAEG